MKKIRMSTTKKSLILCIFVVSTLLLSTLVVDVASASGETIVASNVTGDASGAIDVTTVSINGTGNDDVPVRLHVSSGVLEMTATPGVTFNSGLSGETLEFHGNRNDVNTALQSLTYTRNSGTGTDTLEISLVDPGDVFFPDNGHLYQIITTPLTWVAAQPDAAGRSKYGAQGYLATITSANENAFVAERLTQTGWIGASDAAVEGDWKWVTGPETGTSFWSGSHSGNGGVPVGGQYSNWNSGEPNNSSDEDCAQFLSGGTGYWNDLRCNVPTLAYVVEYGAPGDLPTVESDEITITAALEPDVPTGVSATAGIESSQVSFTAPGDNDSPITSYTVTSTPGGIEATGTASPITVTGLTAGTAYTFTVVATNAIGDSNPSSASNSVTPTSAPSWDDDLIDMPRVDVPFSDSISASGYPAVAYEITGGALPAGLVLDENTGEITGTPTVAGPYEFEVTVSNGVGSDLMKTFSGQVASAPAVALDLEFQVGDNLSDDLSVLISGAGLLTGSQYTVVVESTPRTIASGTISSSGSFSARAYIPRDIGAGSHSITLYATSVTGRALSDVAYFRVNNSGKIIAVSDTSAIGDELPLTGLQISGVIAVAFALIGAGLLFAKRHTRYESNHAG